MDRVSANLRVADSTRGNEKGRRRMEVSMTPEDSTPEDSPIRFGVLGTGRITRRLVSDLQQTPNVQVTAIASRDSSRAKWYADQYGIPNAHAGYESLVVSDQVDAVYIALPPSLHAQWSLASIANGKHVLCEKPLTTRLSDTVEIAKAAGTQKVHWLDAASWLFHPRTQAMRAPICDGRLGQLRHISSAVSFFEPFQSGDHRLSAELGGGCLLDLGWYAAGMICWATGGQLPHRVRAMATFRDGIDIRITACCVSDQGWSATLSCAYDTATRKWAEIAGTDASVICDDFTRPWPDRPPRFWIHDRAGKASSHLVEGDQQREMITTFCNAIHGKASLEPYQSQSLATQSLLAAISASVQSEHDVVIPHSPTPEFLGNLQCD